MHNKQDKDDALADASTATDDYSLHLRLLLMAVPWRLVTGVSPHRPGFAPGSVRAGLGVDKVTLGQAVDRVLRFSPVSFHSGSSYSYIIWGMNKIGPLVAAVQRHNIAPSTWTTWLGPGVFLWGNAVPELFLRRTQAETAFRNLFLALTPALSEGIRVTLCAPEPFSK
jgi:hypothetical protein